MGQAASAHLSGTGAQLIKAAKAGDADAVTELVSRHPALLGFSTFRAFGPAHYAARADHIEVLQQLVAKAEELDHINRQQQQGGYGRGSAGGGALGQQRQQQQHHQRPHSRSGHSSSSQHHQHHQSLVAQLVNAPSDRGITPLMLAVHHGCLASVKLLLAKGADPWAIDKLGGRTALHYAAWRGASTELLQLLLDAAGPSGPVHFPNRPNTKYVDVRTASGFTAVHFAVQAGNQEVLATLLSMGANPLLASLFDCLDSINAVRGTTALHLAARYGSAPLVKQLLKAYMEQWYHRHLPDPRLLMDGDSQLPCQVAARREHHNIARMLLPSTPLASLFADGELELLGPSTLAAIAAAVLRSTLSDDLQQCVVAQRQQQQLCAACSSSAAAACGSSACSSSSTALQGRHTQQQVMQLSAAGADDDDDADACAAAADAAALDSRVRRHSDKSIDDEAAAAAAAAAAASAQSLSRPVSPALSSAGAASAMARAPSSSAPSEASSDGAVCGVCFDAAPQVVLWPCSHELCAECCTHLLALNSRCVLVCPYCRGGVAHLRSNSAAAAPPPTQRGSLPKPHHHAQQDVLTVGAPLVV